MGVTEAEGSSLLEGRGFVVIAEDGEEGGRGWGGVG